MLLTIAGGTSCYLYYDWYKFNNSNEKQSDLVQIYSWKNKQGVMSFSDREPVGIKNVKVKEGFKYVPPPKIYWVKAKLASLTGTAKAKIDSINKDSKITEKVKKSVSSILPGSKNKKIIMYSTKSCGYCKQAKNYFSDKDLKFTEYDINNNDKARKEFKKLGGTGVPLIVIDGKVIKGFNKNLIDKYLL